MNGELPSLEQVEMLRDIRNKLAWKLKWADFGDGSYRLLSDAFGNIDRVTRQFAISEITTRVVERV